MAIRTRVQVFDKSVLFGTNGALGPAARSRLLADFARSQIGVVDAQNAQAVGRPVPHDTIVDGARTDDLNRVKPDGVIVARWRLGTEVVQHAVDLLHRSGPVKSGHYRQSVGIYADGREVETIDETAGASEVVLLSLVPYARKIERGQKGYAPGAVYESVAAVLAARYGNIAKIKFSYRTVVGESGLNAYAAKALSGRAFLPSKKYTADQRRQNEHARLTRNPAIVISF